MLVPRVFGESLFDDFFDDFAAPARRNIKQPVPVKDLMKTDVKETEKGYDLAIDLPGYKKDDVEIELKDGVLSVKAESKTENETKDEEGKFIRRERFFGTCSRKFYVGEDIEEDGIKAKFEDGILKIEIPKKAPEPVVENRRLITIED